jgi:hypothetical protein
MFKITLVASKLREEMAHYLGMVKDSDVLQILHLFKHFLYRWGFCVDLFE